MNGFICKAFGAKQKVRGLRKGAHRPDLWIIDDLETPQTIKNNRMQDDYADWIEADVLATMTGKRRRLIGANNRFASRMVQTILKQRHPDWDWHLVKAYDPVTYEPAWKSMYSPSSIVNRKRTWVFSRHMRNITTYRLSRVKYSSPKW